jgi:hypothetical protein
MMATLDRPRIEYRTPLDLIDEVRRGVLRVPTFQRGFKWESADVIALFDSVWRGFAIGNLLLWRRPAPAASVQVGPVTIRAPELDSALGVVDGQQRITSLVGALTAADSSTDSRFRVNLNLVVARFHTLGLRQEAPPQWIPVSRLVETPALLAWMREGAGWLTDSHIAVADSAAKAIREYQIPTYVVTADDEIALRMIFDRLNNTGKPMTRAEVSTHCTPAWRATSRTTYAGQVRWAPAWASVASTTGWSCGACSPTGVVTSSGRTSSTSSGRTSSTSSSSPDDRRATFQEVAAALRVVVEFLQLEAGIPHGRLPPYGHVVPVLTRFVRLHGTPRDRVPHLLRRWVWRDAVAGSAAVDQRHHPPGGRVGGHVGPVPGSAGAAPPRPVEVRLQGRLQVGGLTYPEPLHRVQDLGGTPPVRRQRLPHAAARGWYVCSIVVRASR